MKKIITIGMTMLTSLSTLYALSTPARADFGDFLLGVGAAAGTSAIIKNSNRRSQESRNNPTSPDQEYYRGIQDGMDGKKYDNPRGSADYDGGYEEGLSRRKGKSPSSQK